VQVPQDTKGTSWIIPKILELASKLFYEQNNPGY